jgi:hypothetical protein
MVGDVDRERLTLAFVSLFLVFHLTVISYTPRNMNLYTVRKMWVFLLCLLTITSASNYEDQDADPCKEVRNTWKIHELELLRAL